MWPANRTPIEMNPNSTPVASIHSGGSVVVGPFEWTPVNGTREALLATATVVGDPSNVDPNSALPCASGPTPLSQLVPFDNNIALLDTTIVPGGGGKTNLRAALLNQTLHVENPFDTNIHVDIEWSVPAYLSVSNWHPSILKNDRSFDLAPHGSHDVPFHFVAGKTFKKDDVVAAGLDSAIELKVWADGQIIGGRTYWIDPSVTTP